MGTFLNEEVVYLIFQLVTNSDIASDLPSADNNRLIIPKLKWNEN